MTVPASTTGLHTHPIVSVAPGQLRPSSFSVSVYGEPAGGLDDLITGIRDHGILVPLVVVPGSTPGFWEVISGHRRLACALALSLAQIPCEIRTFPTDAARRLAILEYNRQRSKSFSQLMREADALEELWKPEAKDRRVANLQQNRGASAKPANPTDRRNSDDRESSRSYLAFRAGAATPFREPGRTDVAIASQLGLGGKDLYRQARAIWHLAKAGDVRAASGITQLDAGTKTIYAAYKDLRRRDRYSSDFRPTPYDVWPFKHDRAFGIPHAGAIPPAIIAHTLYYYTSPGALVVDPMAGGGTTLDVCQSMGRCCFAFDISPARADISPHDIRSGFPPHVAGCDLIFCDPPYHTMLAQKDPLGSVAASPFSEWVAFLHDLARHAFATVRAGGYLALLLAAQTEKDLPAGAGYLDHAFFGYLAALRAGFLPERRISCPMDGAYLPQHIRRARREGRLLGQVRDLLIMRKPSCSERPHEGVLDLCLQANCKSTSTAGNPVNGSHLLEN
jgi:hypothetical protein